MIRLINTISLFLLFSAVFLVSCGTSEDPDKADSEPAAAFQESHRPQFHFSPPKQWMNDPNGMVFYDGEYHLFYQHYPDSNVWGPMHWGHAVSPDLVHWENLPVALYPDTLGYIFSGSAVVDWNNTSGLGEGDEPPLIAIFTHHDPEGEQAGSETYQYQSIAYSNDRGRSWTKYEGNPVVKNPGIRDFRDPKVFWHEDSEQWVMIFAAKDRVRLYNSPNLIDWAYASEFGAEWGNHGGVWECPDLFELPVEGTGESRWVMLLSINPGGPNGGSATQYFIGNFDGQTFTLDDTFAEAISESESARWLDYGRDNYAGVTWSDVPEEDGRRIFIGWMSNWNYANVVPTTAWRSAMTLPRRLVLWQAPQALRLASQPVAELTALREHSHQLNGQMVEGTLELTDQLGFSPTLSELTLEFEAPESDAVDFGVELSNARGERYRIGYRSTDNSYYSDRTQAGKTDFADNFATGLHLGPRNSTEKTIKLHLFFDVASAELFADDGKTLITDIFFPNEDFDQISLYSEGGAAQLRNGTVYGLKSIWRELQ